MKTEVPVKENTEIKKDSSSTLESDTSSELKEITFNKEEKPLFSEKETMSNEGNWFVDGAIDVGAFIFVTIPTTIWSVFVWIGEGVAGLFSSDEVKVPSQSNLAATNTTMISQQKNSAQKLPKKEEKQEIKVADRLGSNRQDPNILLLKTKDPFVEQSFIKKYTPEEGVAVVMVDGQPRSIVYEQDFDKYGEFNSKMGFWKEPYGITIDHFNSMKVNTTKEFVKEIINKVVVYTANKLKVTEEYVNKHLTSIRMETITPEEVIVAAGGKNQDKSAKVSMLIELSSEVNGIRAIQIKATLQRSILNPKDLNTYTIIDGFPEELQPKL